MTADIELPPIAVSPYTDRILAAARKQDCADPLFRILEDYARANVAHATAAKDAEIEALRADKSDLEAALEYLKAHKENAVMNRDGIIKALSEVRDEQGAEIHKLRAELETEKGQAEFYRTTRNWNQRKAERLAEALQLARDLVEDWAGYAGEYFQKKHNLEGDLALLDHALRDHAQEVGNG